MTNNSNSEDSLEFLKQEFREYYKTNKIDLPDRFGRREYAFVLFGGRGMLRHIGFDKKTNFSNFLK